MTVDIPRETALKILYEVNENGAYVNIALGRSLEREKLEVRDRAFITELVYGILQWRLSIDWTIGKFSSIKIKKLSPWILNILRLGVYQLLYMDKIPESAACNECVKLSRKYGHSASSGFVNAVLRSIARQKVSLPWPDSEKEPENYLSVKYAHPLWMVQEWMKRFGREFTEALLTVNNQSPEFTVRVNTLKVSREQLMEELEESGVPCEKGKYLPDAITLKNPSGFSHLEAFREGRFQVQDESSMLVGRILDPQPGDFVMDVCSAPGGKATHLAQLMENRGTVLARDIHEHKIGIIEEAARRLGTTIVKAELFDAIRLDEEHMGKADRVLVDAPCTGLGILRRKPDIKWSRSPEDKKEILALQRCILNSASKYVKKGGTLVYSTCTIEEEENQGVVNAFLEASEEFYPEDITPLLPKGLVKPDASKGTIQLFPHVDGVDGFFIARLRRRET